MNEFLSGDLAQSFNALSRNALVITETEDRLIAAAGRHDDLQAALVQRLYRL
ncbi:hypothetical protein [Mesorhizobium sp.]|uniref:hypothetical protein n=1 Tax=Mesorhizobium sp. TaxID=1871066 RepID=UPI00257D4FFE|nr:hypothetical protein [Mesorhizobium sp.]